MNLKRHWGGWAPRGEPETAAATGLGDRGGFRGESVSGLRHGRGKTWRGLGAGATAS